MTQALADHWTINLAASDDLRLSIHSMALFGQRSRTVIELPYGLVSIALSKAHW